MKFKMNNIKWEIKEKSQEEIKEYINKSKNNSNENTKSRDTLYYGITWSDLCEIWLDKDIKNKRNTLIHELTHCYLRTYMTHLDKKYIEEDIADISANSHDIIDKIVNDYFKKAK